jgi:transcriptional regulator with XRE-family HTH domain
MARSVHDLCAENKMSVERVAEQSGLEPGRVQAIYLGRWTPSPSERDRIAAVFGISREDISWGHKTPIQHIYGEGPT